MNTTANTHFAKHGQNIADHAANKIQGGLRDAKRRAEDAGDQLSSKVEELRSGSKPLITKVLSQARTGVKGMSDATKQLRDGAKQASDSVISYTKENPLQAIVIAVAAGALIATVLRSASRLRN